MPDFKPTEDIISMSEFRTTLADCVARTAETHRPIILTQNGRATSVFLSAADWERLSALVEKAEAYEDLLVAEGEADRGETISLEDFEKEIKNRREKENRKAKSKTGKVRAA